MWRRHSCLPRPDSSGRLLGVLQSASRLIGTRQSETLRHAGGCEVNYELSLSIPAACFRVGAGHARPAAYRAPTSAFIPAAHNIVSVALS
jgi:hypothetical protein